MDMGNSSGSTRRTFGTVCVMVPVGMVILGLTALKNTLDGLGFLVYWLICLALTGLAILMAFLDVRALQRRTRQEQRDLLDSTLKKIEADARKRRPE